MIHHFQLRNLLCCDSDDDIYYHAEIRDFETEHEACICNLGTAISCTARERRNLIKVTPTHFATSNVSVFAVKGDVLATAGFENRYTIMSRASGEWLVSCRESLIDHDREPHDFINHVTLPKEGQSSFSSNEGSVQVLDYVHNKMVMKQTYEFAINCHIRNPDGKLQVLVGDSATSLSTETESGKVLHELKGHSDYGVACAWSENGYHVATGNQDLTVKIWDTRMIRPGLALTTIHQEANCVRSLKFSPLRSGKNVLAAAESADVVSVIDADSFGSRQVIDFFGEVRGMDFDDKGEGFHIGVSDFIAGGILSFTRQGNIAL